MRRRIEVRAPGITITAVLDTTKCGRQLVRSELEEARDSLADELLEAASQTRHFECPLNRVKVSK